MEKETHVIKFRIHPKVDSYYETVYMTDEAFNKLPIIDDNGWTQHDVDSIISEYFTKEKIEEYKKRLCEQIMNNENPFAIYEVDLDCYTVDKDKIWK